MHFKRLGVRDGVADYLVILPRRNVAIELKDEDGEQSKGQEQFERQWKACGNVYVVVRTLEDFQGTMNALALFS